MNNLWLCAAVVMMIQQAFSDDIRFETKWLRLSIKMDGTLTSVYDKAGRKEYLNREKAQPFCSARIAGKETAATAVTLQGDELHIAFGAGGSARVRVTSPQRVGRDAPPLLVFEVLEVTGDVETLILLSLPVTITQNVGTGLGVAWNDSFAITGLAANYDTESGVQRGKTGATLFARSHKRFGLTRGKVALIGALKKDVLKVIAEAERVLGLPDGVSVKQTEENRKSYVFTGGMSEQNVDDFIAFAKAGGFGQILLLNYNWATSVGHYEINTRYYPHGMDGLKKAIDRCHQAGLKVGMHVWASKVSRWDSYVTPVPDKRLYKDRVATLAEDTTRVQHVLKTNESLKDFPGEQEKLPEGDASLYRFLIVDDEIIAYGGLREDGKGVIQCERGALGTIPKEHKAGAKVYHIGVDPSIRMFMVDLDTDILDEMADRIAKVFNECGFDMVYFDGVEDVPQPFWHYVAKFQTAVWQRFQRKPIVCQGTFYVHYTWHIFSRCSTIDYVLPDLKEDVRTRSLPYMLRTKQDLMPCELGWFPWRVANATSAGAQLDDVEYLCSKASAYDCAFSIVGGAEMLTHPKNEELLETVRRWETLRLNRGFRDAEIQEMQPFDKEFTLLCLKGKWQPYRQQEIVNVAGRSDVMAFLVDADGRQLASIWHTWGEGSLEMTLPARATDEKDRPVELKDGVPLGRRLLLDFGQLPKETSTKGSASRRDSSAPPTRREALPLKQARLPKDQIVRALQSAQVEVGAGNVIWVQAENAQRFAGEMAKASEKGVKDDGTFGDFIVPTAPPGSELKEWFAEYAVDVPKAGTYFVWGRFQYPSGAGESFAFAAQTETPSRDLSMAIGNSAVKAKEWHWDSQSGGDAVPPGSGRRVVRLPKGKVTIRIYAREGGNGAESNPRLDVICLTDNPAYVPNDEDCRKAVAKSNGG